jgi:hypothetical protein
MSYSIDSDVLAKISNIKIASGINVSSFRDSASINIDVNIRKLYIVPVDSDDTTDMAYLKDIESDLAAGNLLESVSTVDQIDTLHALGEELIKKGNEKLNKLISEEVILIGAQKDTDSSDDQVNFPSLIFNSPDEESNFNKTVNDIDSDARRGETESEENERLSEASDFLRG